MALLTLTNVSKRYPGGVQAVAGIDLAIEAHTTLCLLGPSGCGKSTLLRLIAGLETPDSGRIEFDGRDLRDVPVHARNFGLMFQDYALFPHRTVAENIAFGLRMANWPRARRDERVAAMLDLVNLPGYGDRTIFELSGGERQRVALARSLAPKPALLMLDEPLGSLDRTLRASLMLELHAILQEVEVTAIYVTHDQDEAMALGDQIAIMRAGHIEQVGAPAEVYTDPATPFVAHFLGFANLVPASPASPPNCTAQTPIGDIPLPAPLEQPMILLIRPEAARLAPPAQAAAPDGFHPLEEVPGESRNTVLLTGTLARCTYHGSHYRIQVAVRRGDDSLRFEFELPTFQRASINAPLTRNELPPVGERIALSIHTELTTRMPA